MKSAIVFALTMSIQLLVFVPKIQFLRRDLARLKSGAARRNFHGSVVSDFSSTSQNDSAGKNLGSGSLGNSLRVIGVNESLKKSTYTNEVARAPPSGIQTTEVVSEITNKQIEDLRELLIESGKIDDTTDLRSLVQKVGIVVSDNEKCRERSIVRFASASSSGGVSVSFSSEVGVASQDQ